MKKAETGKFVRDGPASEIPSTMVVLVIYHITIDSPSYMYVVWNSSYLTLQYSVLR